MTSNKSWRDWCIVCSISDSTIYLKDVLLRICHCVSSDLLRNKLILGAIMDLRIGIGTFKFITSLADNQQGISNCLMLLCSSILA